MINIEKVTKRKTGYISINYVEDGEQKCLIASPSEILAWYAAQHRVHRTENLHGLLEGEYKVDWVSDDVVYLTPHR